jgi:hypothetical protein
LGGQAFIGNFRNRIVTGKIEQIGEWCVSLTRRLIMKSILVTYPKFQALPKGVKQMLLASESFFFDQSKTAPRQSSEPPKTAPFLSVHENRRGLSSVIHPSWRN